MSKREITPEQSKFIAEVHDTVKEVDGITKQNLQDTLAVMQSEEPDEPLIVGGETPADEAQEYRYGYGDD